jgi:hypothetical protein
MTTETITQLPMATPQLTDIIYAVQGYASITSPGISVQETLQSIAELLQSTTVLSYPGNPNGFVAGYLRELCWDSVNNILYICSTAGTALTAVWSKTITLTGGSGITINQTGNVIAISSSSSGLNFVDVTGTSASMVTNSAYQANNALQVVLTLPTTASFGDALWISGFGAGGWKVIQAANQQIIVGIQHTTSGATGFLESTNQYDGIKLYCVTPNLVWKNISGPQGALTYV